MVDEGLSAGAVARRLGVAVTTLRTWHQRYGLGPSQHIPGRHRRYTAEDLARLETMRRLTSAGVAAAEAARWARHWQQPMVPPQTLPEGRHGGGWTIPLGPTAEAEARGLATAAMRLDAPAMRHLLEQATARYGVVVTWDTVLRPVLVGIGERYASTAGLIEVEHLISRTVSEVFGAVSRPGLNAPGPAILLACADEEQHSLPLEALAAALAETGVASRLLGARVPPEALRDAVGRTGPAAVVVWAQLAENADPAQLSALHSAPARPLLIAAAGPGWAPHMVPSDVVILSNLTHAVSVLTSVAESPGRSYLR